MLYLIVKPISNYASIRLYGLHVTNVCVVVNDGVHLVFILGDAEASCIGW